MATSLLGLLLEAACSTKVSSWKLFLRRFEDEFGVVLVVLAFDERVPVDADLRGQNLFFPNTTLKSPHPPLVLSVDTSAIFRYQNILWGILYVLMAYEVEEIKLHLISCWLSFAFVRMKNLS